MPSVEELRSCLLEKLSELFRLNQPDLDFGFFRIMHAKAKEVRDFIDNDLLKIISDAFGDIDDARKAELKANIDKEIATAKEYGVADPDNFPKVKEARAAYEAVQDTASAEADVYDHLYRFFERYYDDGDFISRRYYTRETPGRAAPFAIPYNGEEVKLHWANADQYYIKSAEYFSNFTFDLRQAKEVRALRQQDQLGLFRTEDDSPLRVHFRIVEATEGEHGDIKASESSKRFFILPKNDPIELDDDPKAELVIKFEYRPDPEKTGQDNTWQSKRNAEAVDEVLSSLTSWTASLPDEYRSHPIHDYLRLLSLPAPTEGDKKRTLLAKYVNQYTSRNTMDYFIHKDLGGFLRRELDFYIKNEVMHLDDIENADAPVVESYLAKIKVLRKIAGKLIDFLAQLEDFQKKLWLKKKFVVETNYCITLDRICNEQAKMTNEQKWLLDQVVSNKAQWAEWQELGFVQLTTNNEQLTKEAVLEAVDFTIAFNGEKQGEDLFAKKPLTYRKLIDDCSLILDHWNLVLDTRFFDDNFKARLIASIDNFDENLNGILVASENSQALRLLSYRYSKQIDAVITDPPYNTGDDGFHYKDNYLHSSWASMMAERLNCLGTYLKDTSWLSFNINDIELPALTYILDEQNLKPTSVVTVKMSHMSGMKMAHADRKPPKIKEYITLSCKSDQARINPIFEKCQWNDAFERYDSFLFRNNSNNPEDWTRSSLRSAAIQAGIDVQDSDEYESFSLKNAEHIYQRAKNDSLYDMPRDGVFRKIVTPTGMEKIALDGKEVLFAANYLKDIDGEMVPAKVKGDIWDDIGINNSHNEGGVSFENGKKPVKLFERLVSMLTNSESVLLDIFAGSGTLAHAISNLNLKGASRKFILIEMADYFDSILKERVCKVMYSSEWQKGRPIASGKSSSLFVKYLRLESYEDTLNNLRLDDNPQRTKAISANPSLREDYMLHYWLDVETRGSQSLLNIDAFADPTAYTLEVKKPGTDEHAIRAVDLIETFNYLIGLRVVHTSVPQELTAKFKRITDPDLPEDQRTKLVVDGRISQDADGPWWFRKVEGWVPADPANPNNGQQEKVLVVWRKLTGDIEQDNLMLDEWFLKNRISTLDFEFDTIYVNGSNNLPNLKRDDENWKVRLIEEDFMKRMWEAQ